MPCMKKKNESLREFHVRRWRECKNPKLKEKMRAALVEAGWI